MSEKDPKLQARTFGVKKCVWCGKEFIAKSPKQIECKDDHYRPCSVCGEPLLIKESYANYMKYGPRCHVECKGKKTSATVKTWTDEQIKSRLSKMQKTCIERYGVPNAMQNAEIYQKSQQTNKERYGVECNVSQSAQIQDKIKQNSIERYGVEHYTNAPEIRDKMKQGMMAKYGVEHAQQSQELKAKTCRTNLERYGTEHVFQSENFKDKYHEHSIDKFGTYWPMQNPDIAKKSADTLIRNLVDSGQLNPDYIEFRNNPENYIMSHYLDPPTCSKLSEEFNVDSTSIYSLIHAAGIEHLVAPSSMSRIEEEIKDVLQLADPTMDIVLHDRAVIKPQEIDIYLPDYSFGIECNPTWTHNSSIKNPWGGEPKSYKYHYNKSKMAEDSSISLFHIFGYEWTNKRDIIISMILSRVGLNQRRVFARDTYICSIDNNEMKSFLSHNHLIGAGSFPIRYGLRLRGTNELVSVMTFNKMRKTIGVQDDSYELSRFCNLLNTTVIGGASKLFKHFVQDHPEVNSTVSYSDVAHTSGKLYEMLGFEQEVHSDPNYVWVDLRTDVAVNRLNTQKSNIKKFLKDEAIDLTKTEKQIMVEHGFVQVFDSGTIRWRWTRS